MADTVNVVLGLEDLDAALEELPKATARNVLVRTLTVEAQRIADMGMSIAPRDPKHRRHMADTYAVSTKLSKRQASQNVKESDVEVYVGPGPLVQAIQTEFGNAHQAPEPHLRPAWDANVNIVFNGIAKTLTDEIEKARARMARKAEREAEKMKA